MIREIALELTFPEEAILVMEDTYRKLLSNEKTKKCISEGMDYVFLSQDQGGAESPLKIIKGIIENMAEETGIHFYTVNMVFWLLCVKPLRDIYKEKNLPENMCQDSVMDLKYKLMECKEVYNIWGAETLWFKGFFDLSRFTFGRLQYDVKKWTKEDYKGFVKKGDLCFSCHIPSSGPLKPCAVMESFKMLYNFFKNDLKDGKLVIICESWLLYQPMVRVYEENSNMRKFAEMFDIIENIDPEKNLYSNLRRVYGVVYEGPETLKNLPEDTTLRRNMKRYFEKGGIMGFGVGVILFDGEKIINKQKKA